MIGEKEIEVRKSLAGQSTKPLMFEAVFSGQALTAEHLADEHAKK